MEIIRDHVRVSELANAQHETELVQVIRKTIRDEKCEQNEVSLAHAVLLPLFTLRLTGIYVRGSYQSAVRTFVDDAGALRTVWIRDSFPASLPSGEHDWKNI